MTTVAAAASPMAARNGMPVIVRAARAMTTVVPANTTALPAVPTAWPAEASGDIPSASCCRCRDSRNRA